MRRIAAILIAAAALAAGSSAAAGACYYAGGSCLSGNMAANSPSPWTGNYQSYVSWASTYTESYITIQIRPYPGASGYSWSSSVPVGTFSRSYPIQSAQHRCFHSGPSSPVSTLCGFNA